MKTADGRRHPCERLRARHHARRSSRPNATVFSAIRLRSLLVTFERHPPQGRIRSGTIRSRCCPNPDPTSPQHLTRPRRQSGQRHPPAIDCFGELAVVGERNVGQHRQLPVVGQVAHSNDIEVVDIAGRTGRPLTSRGRTTALPQDPPSCSSNRYFGVAAAGVGEPAGPRWPDWCRRET